MTAGRWPTCAGPVRSVVRRHGEVAALAAARLGRHAEAYDGLVAAHERRPDDTEVLLALLRAEAATAGPATALTRYEAYRADLVERLGVDPDPALQRVHAELLAADDPVRTGVRYDGIGLLGRAQDLARLRESLATSRLVTVLGPGGIGKTSVAQVLARESTLPRVHVVELVGVGTGDDVVAAVGAALGVRGLGHRAPGPHPRAAGRHQGSDGAGARHRAGAPRAGQLRARPGAGRLAGRVPAGHHP